MKNKLCIGLFGTCGGSQWRDSFKESYAEQGIEFFDPQKPDWKPEDAEIEAEHLAEDQIILFPITSETYATGSLSEVGFSIQQAIRLDDRRDIVLMIAPDVDQKLKDENPLAAKGSIRARALVKQHLKKLRLANLYIVNTLEEMLEVSLVLHQSAAIRQSINKYTFQ